MTCWRWCPRACRSRASSDTAPTAIGRTGHSSLMANHRVSSVYGVPPEPVERVGAPSIIGPGVTGIYSAARPHRRPRSPRPPVASAATGAARLGTPAAPAGPAPKPGWPSQSRARPPGSRTAGSSAPHARPRAGRPRRRHGPPVLERAGTRTQPYRLVGWRQTMRAPQDWRAEGPEGPHGLCPPGMKGITEVPVVAGDQVEGDRQTDQQQRQGACRLTGSTPPRRHAVCPLGPRSPQPRQMPRRPGVIMRLRAPVSWEQAPRRPGRSPDRLGPGLICQGPPYGPTCPPKHATRGGSTHNQQAGLSQQLAAQRITERLEQAAQARLAHGAGRPRRRRRWWPARRWWQLARWPGVATQPPVRYPHQVR